VKQGRYKLMRFYGDIDAWEFYDLETDPNEMHNRIDDPKVQDKVARLKAKLEALRRQYRDSDGPAVDAPLSDRRARAKGLRDATSAAGAGHHAHH
jgi:hypothetical protein